MTKFWSDPMRILTAAALLCASFAAPAAALPFAQGFAQGFSQGFAPAAPLVQIKKDSKAKPAKAAKAKGKCAPGAICPLVGGGDY
jgi:hypothetical protein